MDQSMEWVEDIFSEEDDEYSYEEEEVFDEDDGADDGLKLRTPYRAAKRRRSVESVAEQSYDDSEIVDFDLGSFNGEDSSSDEEPEDLEQACRDLITIIHKGRDASDADDMIRRCDLKNLYRNLKQQHKFMQRKSTQKEEEEEEPQNQEQEQQQQDWESFDADDLLLDEGLEQPLKADGNDTTEQMNESKSSVEDTKEWLDDTKNWLNNFSTNDWINKDFASSDDEGFIIDPKYANELTPGAEATEVSDSEVYIDPDVESSSYDDESTEEMETQEAEAAPIPQPQASGVQSIEEEESQVSGVKSIEEGVEPKVVKWFERYADDPEDYEEASLKLMAIIYDKDDEDVDLYSAVRRSNSLDLFRYLKQQYWYQVHMGKISKDAVDHVDLEKFLAFQNYSTNVAESEFPVQSLSGNEHKGKLESVFNSRSNAYKSESEQMEDTGDEEQSTDSSSIEPPPTDYSSVDSRAPLGAEEMKKAEEIFEEVPLSDFNQDEQIEYEEEVLSTDSSSIEEPPIDWESSLPQGTIANSTDRVSLLLAASMHSKDTKLMSEGPSDLVSDSDPDSDESSVFSKEDTEKDRDLIEETKSTEPQTDFAEDVMESRDAKRGSASDDEDFGAIRKKSKHSEPLIPEPSIEEALAQEGSSDLVSDSYPDSDESSVFSQEDTEKDRDLIEETKSTEPQTDFAEDVMESRDAKRSSASDDEDFGAIRKKSKHSEPLIPEPSIEEALVQEQSSLKNMTEKQDPSSVILESDDENDVSTASSQVSLDTLRENELMQIVSDAEQDLNVAFEKEAIKALKIATARTTNLKKYYDVFTDEFICVPPIPKAILDYTLIEEAAKHYGTDDEDFPMAYTAVLRTSASMALDEDIDYDYVDKLALDITTIKAEEWNDQDDIFGNVASISPTEWIETQPIIEDRTAKVETDMPESAEENEMDLHNPDMGDSDIKIPVVDVVDSMELVEKEDDGATLVQPDEVSKNQFKQEEEKKRIENIEKELMKLVLEAEKEAGVSIEGDALNALKLAARKTSHLKKYYDFIKDTLIFLPPVAKAIIDKALLEEASTQYSPNSIPLNHLEALQTVARRNLDTSLDYDYMESHAVQVVINNDEDDAESNKNGQVQAKDDLVDRVSETKQEVDQSNFDTKQSMDEDTASEEKTDTLKKMKQDAEIEAALAECQLDEDRWASELKLEEEAELLLENYKEEKEEIKQEYENLEQAITSGLDRIAREFETLKTRHDREEQRLQNESRIVEETRLADEASFSQKQQVLRGKLMAARGRLENERQRYKTEMMAEQALEQEDVKERMFGELEGVVKGLEIEIENIEFEATELEKTRTEKQRVLEQEQRSLQRSKVAGEAKLAQDTLSLQKAFQDAREILDKRSSNLEQSREEDEAWVKKEKSTIKKSYELKRTTLRNERDKQRLSLKASTTIAKVPDDDVILDTPIEQAKPQHEPEGTLQPKENYHSEVDSAGQDDAFHLLSDEDSTTKEDGMILIAVPDHLANTNQPKDFDPTDDASIGPDDLFDPPSPPKVKRPLLEAAKRAKKLMDEKKQSSLPSIQTDSGGIVQVDVLSVIVPDHLMSANQPNLVDSSDEGSIGPDDLFDSPKPPRPKKPMLIAAQKAKIALEEKPKNPQASSGAPVKSNEERKATNLSSNVPDHLLDISQPKKTNSVNRDPSLGPDEIFEPPPPPRPEKPMLEAAKRAKKALDEKRSKSQNLDQGELYKKEFEDLLERDEKGEEIDEDRLYFLELYCRSKVGEDLTVEEKEDLAEFEEAEQERAMMAIREMDEMFVLTTSAVGKPTSSASEIPSPQSIEETVVEQEEKTESVAKTESNSFLTRLQQWSLNGTSQQKAPKPNKGEEDPDSSKDRLFFWRKNGKRLVAEKLDIHSSDQPEISHDIVNAPSVESKDSNSVGKVLPHSADMKPNLGQTVQEEEPSKKSPESSPMSRREFLAEKRRQVVEARRKAKEKLADEEKNLSPGLQAFDKYAVPGASPAVEETRKQMLAEAQRLAEKSARAREARIAREAQLAQETKQVEIKGIELLKKFESEELEEKAKAENARLANEGQEENTGIQPSLVRHMVHEVELLSGFVHRYEKKLDTVCKSLISLAQKQEGTEDMEGVEKLPLPEMYNFVTQQSWFERYVSDDFSPPLSLSKKETVTIPPQGQSVEQTTQTMDESTSDPDIDPKERLYRISSLGEEFVKIDGPVPADIGRFLTSILQAKDGLSKLAIEENWETIVRLSGDTQSQRVLKKLDEIIEFCSKAKLIE